MRVLGVNAVFHDPAAALVVDGEIVAAAASADLAAEALVEWANDAGGRDNITVVVVRREA